MKICGITSQEDALLAVAMGADALGFVFAPSPRQVAVGRVARIVESLPPEVDTLGVFRNDAPQRVVDVVGAAGLTGAQLHGHETPEDSAVVRPHVARLVKAFAVADPALARAAEHNADAILLDGLRPGSGETFDWTIVGDLTSRFRVLLAGGLDPDNVAEAIDVVRPWGVDVSTGVESSPGHKDPRKIKAFIDAARAAAPAAPTR